VCATLEDLDASGVEPTSLLDVESVCSSVSTDSAVDYEAKRRERLRKMAERERARRLADPEAFRAKRRAYIAKKKAEDPEGFAAKKAGAV